MYLKTSVLTILIYLTLLIGVRSVNKTDIDRCATNTHYCSSEEKCVSLERGYRCECKEGFQRDFWTRKCIDIDECTSNKHKCGLNQVCENNKGGFTCSCLAGHRVKRENECEDINECYESNGRVCSFHSKCINTKGSFECKCNRGLETSPSSKQTCVDIDECKENKGLGPCQHRCHNYWGTYLCSCHSGYTLNTDKRTCDDIDECSRYKWKLCEGACKNVPGSYQCTCPEGYTIAPNGVNCMDINECETGALQCKADEICMNKKGSAQCNSVVCPSGYTRDSSNGRHRCHRTKRYCSLYDYECLHIPMSYTFNFIPMVSNIPLPEDHNQLDLFTLRSTSCPQCVVNFQIKLVHVSSSHKSVPLVNMSYFKFTPSPHQALVSLVRTIKGPQDIELELSMDIYIDGYYQGTYVSKVFFFVSEYEF